MSNKIITLTFCIFLISQSYSQHFQNWVNRYTGSGGDDRGMAITVDGSGNIYATGITWGDNMYDCVTIKYDPRGVTQWTRIYNNPAYNNNDISTAICVDASGNVYITGSTVNNQQTTDYLTIKYNTVGVQQWLSIMIQAG